MTAVLGQNSTTQPLVDSENESESEWQLVNSLYFSLKKSCFTENYLVFSLNERLPQMTEVYLDKEDDVLDYCKKVVFTSSSANSSPQKRIRLTENAINESVGEAEQNEEDEGIQSTGKIKRYIIKVTSNLKKQHQRRQSTIFPFQGEQLSNSDLSSEESATSSPVKKAQTQ